MTNQIIQGKSNNRMVSFMVRKYACDCVRFGYNRLKVCFNMTPSTIIPCLFMDWFIRSHKIK